MVRLGELEAEQVQHAAGHVELTRHLEIQQVIADEVAPAGWPGRAPRRRESATRDRSGGRHKRWIVPRNIICKPAALDRVDVVGEVAPLHGPVVDHRESAGSSSWAAGRSS